MVYHERKPLLAAPSCNTLLRRVSSCKLRFVRLQAGSKDTIRASEVDDLDLRGTETLPVATYTYAYVHKHKHVRIHVRIHVHT